jgi:hypothetical protein
MHTTNNKTRKNNRSFMADFEATEPILCLPLKHHLHRFNNSFLEGKKNRVKAFELF